MNKNLRALIGGVSLIGILSGCSTHEKIKDSKLNSSGSINGNKVLVYEENYDLFIFGQHEQHTRYEVEIYDSDNNLRLKMTSNTPPDILSYDNINKITLRDYSIGAQYSTLPLKFKLGIILNN